MPRLVRSAELLTLNAAARLLKIHPTTLRRWADRGDVPSFLTPGGHRRFFSSDLRHFVDQRRATPPHSDVGSAWADKAVQDTRSGLASHQSDTWMSRISDAEREQYRALGQRMMGLLLRHVSRDDDEILTEARGLGQDYGRGLMHAGMTLTEAMAATMFFRDSLMETTMHLPETVRVKPDQNVRLMRRLTGFIDVVQLAIAHTYDKEAGPLP